MSTTLTLGQLRVAMGANLGEGDCLGVATNSPGTTTQVIDTNRYDDDNTWNAGFMQMPAFLINPPGLPDGYQIARINTWALGTNTFTLYHGFPKPPTPPLGASNYEVHLKLSFAEMRNAINNGIGWCGKWLRTQVRDETQTLVSNQYQYTPNYSAALPNAFFPGEVVRVDWQYWTGEPTQQWIELKDWFYLDDETLQFPTEIVDGWAPNPIRFTGYGPVTGLITSDDPTTVIGTFDDDFSITMLIWACTAAAWNTLAAKLQANEQSAARGNAQDALQQAQAARSTWNRGRAQTGRVRTPATPGGWSGP